MLDRRPALDPSGAGGAVDAPLTIGRVVLTVRDLDVVSRFYQTSVGLHRLGGDAASVTLGVERTVLLELRRDAHARLWSPREAGLFHTAFLLPTRADLGCWTRAAARNGVPLQGAADHGVSEAIYLSDPENNGVEIYADRPRTDWAYDGDGTLRMTTDPLDTDDLMRSAGEARWTGLPHGSTVGHVHLQVGAIPPAEAFYGDTLGFTLTCRYPGGSFFGSGGYHHHVAANVWRSRNAGSRTPSTGLASVELLARDGATAAAVLARLADADVPVSRTASGATFADPWGTTLALTAPEP